MTEQNEIDGRDRPEDMEMRLIELAKREVERSKADIGLHDFLLSRLETARVQSADERHPLWPHRYMIVALAHRLPEKGRSKAIIDLLSEAGVDTSGSGTTYDPKVFGRYLNRLIKAVEAELTTAPTKE